MMAKTDLSIVIVSYNVVHFLHQTLTSIFDSDFKGTYDVWVVDNQSVDHTLAMVKESFPSVNLIANTKNVGFSAANNQAIRLRHSKYVLLLNPDTIIEESTLSLCFDYMEAHQDVGALGPRMIDGSGAFLPESKRTLPTIWNSFCKLTYLSDILPKSRWFSGYNLGYLPENQTNEIDVLCGAFMFIRSEVLDVVGLLDEAFFMYGEDIDLSLRIRKAGYKIIYYPESTIIHYKGESTKKSSMSYVRTFYGAMDIYVRKYYSSQNSNFFSIIIRFAILFRGMVSALGRFANLFLRPILDVMLIWFGLQFFKDIWATYYFHNHLYYQGSYINLFISLYVLMWIVGAYLSGWYSENSNSWLSTKNIVTSTGIILIIYGLLPEQMRTSRAILMFGSLIAWITFHFTSFLLRKNNVPKSKNICIVASKKHALEIQDTIKQTQQNIEYIYFVSPDQPYETAFFTQHISHLDTIIKGLKIDEIIYSSQSLPMKEIIQSMRSLRTLVQFKIAGDNSLGIIGSNSKNTRGDLYSLDFQYKLNQPHIRFSKRLLDIFVCFFAITLSPFLWPMSLFSSHFWANIYTTLIGRTTWVGYGGQIQDRGFLPSLAPAIMNIGFGSSCTLMTRDFYLSNNMNYARDYDTFIDFRFISKNLHKLGQKAAEIE